MATDVVPLQGCLTKPWVSGMEQNLTTFPFPSRRRIWRALHPSTTSYIEGLAQDHVDSPALFHNYSLKGPGPTQYSIQSHISPFYQWHSINPKSAGGAKYAGVLWRYMHSKGWVPRPLKTWGSSVWRYSSVSPSEVDCPFYLILFSASLQRSLGAFPSNEWPCMTCLSQNVSH